jgi:elongation factor Tu
LGEISSVEGTRIVKPGDNAAIKVNLTYPVVLNNGLHFTIRERGHNIGIGKITGIAE